MVNKELLIDELLDKISGGTVKDGVYAALDETMVRLKGVGLTKEDLIGGLKATFDEGKWSDVSTDGSKKDLEDLLAYVEKNW